MRREVTLSLARHLLTGIGPLAAAAGWASADQVELIGGAALTIAGTVWAVLDKLGRSP